ncbi:MAG: T9SS type A sorting domain-containing protein [Salinivirgaceae bacterium]
MTNMSTYSLSKTYFNQSVDFIINIAKHLLWVAMLFVGLQLTAQQSIFTEKGEREAFFIDKLQIDLPKTRQQIDHEQNGAYQFAIPFQVKKNMHLLASERKINDHYYYATCIFANDAYAVNFSIQGLNRAEVAGVYVHNLKSPYDRQFFMPSQNSADVTALPILFSDSVLVEVIAKHKVRKGEITISQVGVTYEKSWMMSSQDCEVDIACPQGDLYRNVQRAVVRLVIDNSWLCSGTLLNNTANDERPFLLTANHCIDNARSAANTVFYFNYESPECDGLQSDYPSPNLFTLSGSSLRATKNDEEGALDFTLLELDQHVPEHYNAYYAGWSATATPPEYSICIHHPVGDVKKISLDFDVAGTYSFSIPGSSYDDNSHWRIFKWDLGATEGGSSGSALFNTKMQVVGDLTGGEASCDYPYNDFYSKFNVAFDKYADSSQQLRYWLDPLNLGVFQWNGYPEDSVIDNQHASVFPNPASGHFFVEGFNCDEDVNAEIFALNGALLWSEIINCNHGIYRISIPSELKGIYIVRVGSKKSTHSQLLKFE